MIKSCDESAAADWRSRGVPPEMIAELIGCTVDDLEKIRNCSPGSPVPLPDEIQERAAKIRERWSPAEENRRRGHYRLERYSFPMVDLSEIDTDGH